MLVDAHLHVWRARPDDPRPAATIVSPASDVPLELFRQYMAEYNVGRAVLVQPLFPGEDNGYLADCAAADPDRLAAVCVVDPRAAGAADRLEYWVRERGCRGLRLRPRVPEEAACFGRPDTWPLWQRAADLGAVVNVLAGPEHLPAVAALAERFPETPILLDHLAHPDAAAGVAAPGFAALLDLARYPHVSLKVSGHYYYSRQDYPFADCRDLVRAAYDRFGPRRLLWGSDFPHVLLKTGYGRALALPGREYGLPAEDLELLLGGNAARLYWPTPPAE